MTMTLDTRRVVWADDAVLVRLGLVGLLQANGVDVVGEADDFVSTMSTVRCCQPDVAILDVSMPPTFTDEGIRAAIELRRSGIRCGLLIVSQDVDAMTAQRLLNACPTGVGYLLKNRLTDIGSLVDTIDRVARGEVLLDPVVGERLLRRRRESELITSLTPTEYQVLAKMAEGHSNARIADELIMAERTVETHVSHIFRDLGLPPDMDSNRRVKAVIWFLRHLP